MSIQSGRYLECGPNMKFDVSIDDSFASFIDDESGVSVFIDSFGNNEFEIRIGTIENSKSVGVVCATTSE